jgi:hypothetical protein
MSGSSSQGIFLSYRRQDATADALLLQKKLHERIPNAHVFMDLESIDPGADFPERIRQAVDSSAVLVALIGPQWLTLAGQQGREEDYVRFEVQTALDRGVPVIPVLVNGAEPPQPEHLPAGLQGLARLNAFELSYVRYEDGANQLVEFIQRVLASQAEHITFSHEVSADLARRLREEIDPFHNYLARLGLAPYEREPPKLGLRPDQPGSLYNPTSHRIEISPEFIDYPYFLFREYCNYALTSDDESGEFADAAYELKSGLGFYLPCSFTGDPAGFARFGVNLGDTKKMTKKRSGTPSPASQERGYIWASIFWAARQLAAGEVQDKLVAAAWLATVAAAGDNGPRSSQQPRRVTYGFIEQRFVQQLLGLAPSFLASEECQALSDLLKRRGVLKTTSVFFRGR